MKPKAQFITIQPKTEEAKELFNTDMRQLHSCKVLKKENNQILLNPIAGNLKFWVKEQDDKNWMIIK